MWRLIFFLCASVALFSSASVSSAASPEETLILDFPQIPDSLIDPGARADFVIQNFWPSDSTIRSSIFHNPLSAEQNFVNFIQFFPFAHSRVKRLAMQSLMNSCDNDSSASASLMSLADKYLYETESGFRDLEAYGTALQHFLNRWQFNDDRAIRYRYILDDVNLNAPGNTANNFAFSSAGNEVGNLHDAVKDTPFSLLIFYNPLCDTCHETIALINQNADIRNLIASRKLCVIAINAESDTDSYDSGIPADWIQGNDTDRILDHELYTYPFPPAIYLLDNNATVILKEPSLQRLFFYVTQL